MVLFAVTGLSYAAAPTNATSRLAGAVTQAHADVKQATEALIELRQEHADARRPLVSKLDALQTEVKALRAEAENLQRAKREAADAHEGLAARVDALEENERFMTGLLIEYRRSLETRASRAELQLLGERLSQVDGVLRDQDGAQLLGRATDSLLSLAEEWNRERLGGVRFSGEAVDAEGAALDGTYAVFGPVSYFASSNGVASGPTEPHLGGLCPAVFSRLSPEEAAAVHVLCGAKETVVPVDVTGGDALKVVAAKPSLAEHLKTGGVVMVPLAVVGALAFVLALVKTTSLARIRMREPAALRDVLGHLQAGQVEQARALAATVRAPLRHVVMEGVEHHAAPKEHLEELLTERIMALIPSLERHLALLAVLAGVAPLLGLLGTVTGMIHTFQLVTIFGQGDARLLSGGISEALVTTQVGLAIAIPVLLVHAFLARRVRTIVALLERVAAEFVHALKIQVKQGD